MTSYDEPGGSARVEAPNNAGWATFEARVRGKRFARCVDRANTALSQGHLGAAREALEEAKVLSPLAPEIAQLQARVDSEAIVAAAESVEIREVAVDPQELEQDPGWRGIAGAMAALVLLFSLFGFGLVQLYFTAPAQQLIGAGEDAPAADVTAPLAAADSTGAVEPTGQRSQVAASATSSTATSPSAALPPATPSDTAPATSSARIASAGPSSAPATGTTGTIPAPRRPVLTAGDGGARPASGPSAPSPTAWRWRQPLGPQPPADARPAASRLDTPSSTDRAITDTAAMEPVPVPSSSSFSAPEAGSTAGMMRASATEIVSSPVSERPVKPEEARRLEAALIRAILLRYENAYNRLDANAALSLWPGADHAALTQAFSGLNSQRVSLGLCDITVIGDIGGASCVGKARWENRVGGALQTADRQWTFNLRKIASEWRIEQIRVRDLEP